MKLYDSPGACSLAAHIVLQAWLNFIGTELHKCGFSIFFNPAANAEFKTATGEKLAGRPRWLDEQLEGKTRLLAWRERVGRPAPERPSARPAPLRSPISLFLPRS